MVECVQFDLAGGQAGVVGAVFRYAVLQRLQRCAAPRGVRVLAFGFTGDGPRGPVEAGLRLVLEAERESSLQNVVRGVKVGTVRGAERWGVALRSGPSERRIAHAEGLLDAVVWAHRAVCRPGVGPLDSPWSSHRDLLCFRRAPFYDASVLRGRVEPRLVHTRCGGEPLPDGWPPKEGHLDDLALLLRLAGGVLGVLPADRRCFRLFVHLARARGWRTKALALALDVTTRRVRQLAAEVEPDLGLALLALSDRRLGIVP